MSRTIFDSTINLSQKIKKRQIGSAELLELFIQQIENCNNEINAVVTTDLDMARRKAKEADEALSRGEDWGIFHGIPLTIKDSIEVAGMPCTWGDSNLKNYVPSSNAAVVQPLLDEGAIVFGKTNLPPHAMDWQSINEVFGETRNPWDLTRTPGGSSGGSAAALAAGMTSLEIGSDIAGSIRIPASFCGVFGHKPSYGIISYAGQVGIPGVYPKGWEPEPDLAVTGPMARSAEDLRMTLGTIIGSSRKDRLGFNVCLPQPRHKRLDELRIAVWMEDDSFPVEPEIRDCLQNVIDDLGTMGANVKEAKPDINLRHCFSVYQKLLHSVFASQLSDEEIARLTRNSQQIAEMDCSPISLATLGSTLSHGDWMKLDFARMQMRAAWAEFFKNYDVLLSPVTCMPAFKPDHTAAFERKYVSEALSSEGWFFDYIGPWVAMATVSYLPATSAPIGKTKDGLPVGVQIVGPYLEDFTTIHAASLLEEVFGGFTPPPKYC